MTHLAVAAAVGFLGGRLLWLATRSLFATPALARTNWRGRTLPTAAGVLLAGVALVTEAARLLAGALGAGPSGATQARVLVLLATCGFTLLGAVDDVAGSADARGFRGHLGALARGRITTGTLKLAGGVAVALAVVSPLEGRSAARLLADAALVALGANLGNLLDRAPGRVIKVGVVAFVATVAAVRRPARLDAVAVVVGASVGLLPDDLHERLMLGDAGANALGAVVGLGLVLTAGMVARTAALVAVAGLNLAGELVSFSHVIDAVPPLRVLDRAGRRA